MNSDLLWCRLAPSHPSQITDLSLLFYFIKIQEYISIFFWSDKSCLLVFINDQILRIKTYTVQMYTVQMIEIDKAVLYSYYHKHNMKNQIKVCKLLRPWVYFQVWAASWQNQQCGCAPSEDSGQPGHLPSLIRVFAVRMKKTWILSYPLGAQRRLWSDWADAQADLSLRWKHSHFIGFVMRRLI